jgi:hypothetical protein
MAIIMNSMNKQVQENTIQSQNEWNACLLFRNKQLAKEVKELRSVSAAMDCSASQLQAMSQLLRLHTTPAYGIIRSEREWQNLFALLDMLYGSGFLADLGERQLTAQELKLCYLVRAHLNNKAIALLFNVTTSSVVKAKQRLKRKLALLPSDSFDNYIQHY